MSADGRGWVVRTRAGGCTCCFAPRLHANRSSRYQVCLAVAEGFVLSVCSATLDRLCEHPLALLACLHTAHFPSTPPRNPCLSRFAVNPHPPPPGLVPCPLSPSLLPAHTRGGSMPMIPCCTGLIVSHAGPRPCPRHFVLRSTRAFAPAQPSASRHSSATQLEYRS